MWKTQLGVGLNLEFKIPLQVKCTNKYLAYFLQA